MIRFVLASSSPRRSEILKQMQLNFDVIKSDCSEYIEDNVPPQDVVKILAERKALNVIEKLNNDYNKYNKVVLISADTIVSINNTILGKPKNQNDAFEMLKMLSGKKHTVSTGMSVVILTENDMKITTCLTESNVYFKPLCEELINAYIKTGEPMDKAGSYAVQGFGSMLIKRLEGDFFSVMGLSASKLYDILKDNSIDILINRQKIYSVN